SSRSSSRVFTTPASVAATVTAAPASSKAARGRWISEVSVPKLELRIRILRPFRGVVMAVLSVVFLDGERPGRQVVPYRTRLVVDRRPGAPSAPARPGRTPRAQRGRRGPAGAAAKPVTGARAPMAGSWAGRRVG